MATYYVSSSGGSDSNAGTSEGAPWKSVYKVNQTSFAADDVVCFKRGDVFLLYNPTGSSADSLIPKTSGTPGHPIVFQDYGSGALPIISGFRDYNGWTRYGSGLGYTWQCAVGVETQQFLVDGVRMTLGLGGKAALNDHEWCWESNVLYFRDDSYTLGSQVDALETLSTYRWVAVNGNSQDYITLKNLRLQGDTGYCLYLAQSEVGWLLDNVEFGHGGDSGSTGNAMAVFARGTSNSSRTVTNLAFQNCPAVAGVDYRPWNIKYTQYVSVTDCGITANRLVQHKIVMDNSNDLTVHGCTIPGLQFQGSKNVLVEVCTLTGGIEGGCIDIETGGGTTYHLDNIIIQNCVMYDDWYAGVWIGTYGTTYDVTNCIIRNNFVINCGESPCQGQRACTVSDATDRVTDTLGNHMIPYGADAPIYFTTSQYGVTAGTPYYIFSVLRDSFRISTEPLGAGTQIEFTGSGSMTYYVGGNTGGILLTGNLNGVQCYGNIVVNCGMAGEAGTYAGIAVYPVSVATHQCKNIRIWHNTLYKNADRQLQIKDGAFVHPTDIQAKDNILVADDTPSLKLTLQVDAVPAADATVIFDYNLHYQGGSGNMVTHGANSYTLAQWATFKSATGHEANSPAPASPAFVNAGGSYALDTDFQLAEASPAVDVGLDVDVDTDYGGYSRVSIPDIGAWEYQGEEEPELPEDYVTLTDASLRTPGKGAVDSASLADGITGFSAGKGIADATTLTDVVGAVATTPRADTATLSDVAGKAITKALEY